MQTHSNMPHCWKLGTAHVQRENECRATRCCNRYVYTVCHLGARGLRVRCDGIISAYERLSCVCVSSKQCQAEVHGCSCRAVSAGAFRASRHVAPARAPHGITDSLLRATQTWYVSAWARTRSSSLSSSFLTFDPSSSSCVFSVCECALLDESFLDR